MNTNDKFIERTKLYFEDKYELFLNTLNNPKTQGLFLNTNKAKKEVIFELIDFNIIDSNLNPNGYYHENDNIGKSKAYELGLIYPQDVESSFSASLVKKDDVKLIVDLCAAPGGKSINFINKYPNTFCISNDINYKRATILASNLERLGLDRTYITSKKPDDFIYCLQGNTDIVILDAPCSGEGMIRKYPEILDNYSIDSINELAEIQKDLLEVAYKLIKKNGIIVYSTCTYALEEDENQVLYFLDKHKDIELIHIDNKDNYSKLDGTIKLCPLNNTEGQFIAIFKKNSNLYSTKQRYLKSIKNKLVDDFIKDNLNIDSYYLYNDKDKFYLSFEPLLDLGYKVIRKGIYLGDIIKNRFEPNHNLYRSNSLINKYKKIYDLNDKEYQDYVLGKELKVKLDNGYYLITYKNLSLGFGKVSNNTLKNKYPKGLRQ